ncbi:MAG: hypothetical protein WKF81_03695 [Thermomicrobiales bacterium]
MKIEVKSSDYLQSWRQKQLSTISFSGLITSRWDAESGRKFGPFVVADAYVFSVQTRKDPAHYDPLSVESWDFYVIAGSRIRELNQKSMRLSTVRRHAGSAVVWDELRDAIHSAIAAAG